MAATGRFLSGLLLGLAVIALALVPVYADLVSSYVPVIALALLLLAGALYAVRRDGARVAGVVTGAVAGTAAFVALLLWLLSSLS
jgi:hypothetical protein